jgi:fatty-acyl-CoA synthase
MMEQPLRVSSLIAHAARHHGDTEIVSRTVEGPIHRYTYAESQERAKRLANALGALGVGPGDRVGTLAWNGYRHFELYYGVSGRGAVCHTINPRLFPEQIVYIINHAEDSCLFLDLTFVPLIEALADKLKPVRHYVILTDEAHMPETRLPDPLCYETLLAARTADYDWPAIDENTAASLCYTSGTTGHPKGVLYSHRSTVLHSFAICSADALGMSSRDAVMPVVPMFHANAWGYPYGAAMCGAKLVLPGPGMDGASLVELMEREGVTNTAGVPTIWLGLLAYLKESGKRLEGLRSVLVGGSAVPRSMIERFHDEHGVELIQGWGMTEMSPLGTLSTLKGKMEGLSQAERTGIQVKQGRALFGVDMKIVDDDGAELPWDGMSQGHLLVRGPWVASGYFKGEGGEIVDAEGWFDTGDISTIDADGFMQITDRSKDVIKSGGEWISSIDLENAAVGHPEILEAAVIGLPHPKWSERPLLIAVRARGSRLTGEAMLAYLDDRVAKWWIPDDVVFVDELPHTATGKILKTKLREDFRNHSLPTAVVG